MFEENSIIGQISKGKYPEEIVETKYGEFILKYPSGKDINVISRKTAALSAGMSFDAFPLTVTLVNRRDMTLSTIITSYPDKFPKNFQGDDIIDFPDEEVKNSLYKAFNTFYSNTQEKISGKSKHQDTGE